MKQQFDLQKHIEQGVEKIVADTIKATLKNPKESAFMVRFAAASRKASKTRKKNEEEGLHVPAFLIASITSRCNLNCAGCYSRFNKATVDTAPVQQLTSEEWLRIFREAEDLGISFIMLAGGEPMIRRDIIEAAGSMQNIIFPVFTNGTFVDERYFNEHRRRQGNHGCPPRKGNLRQTHGQHEGLQGKGSDLRHFHHRDD